MRTPNDQVFVSKYYSLIERTRASWKNKINNSRAQAVQVDSSGASYGTRE